MAIKGQKFQHYPESIKREAVKLHVEDGWTYREITEHLGIHDKDRVKKWMRKYRTVGERVFEDGRGNPYRAITEEERRSRRIELENEALKKCLAMLNQEVSKQRGKSSRP